MAENSVDTSFTGKLNPDVISSTINYYGHGLLTSLASSKSHLLQYDAMKDIDYHTFKARSDKLVDETEVELYTSSVDFVIANADHLFCKTASSDRSIDVTSEFGSDDKYKTMPPLEYFLHSTKVMRLNRFYKNVKRGDILICRASPPSHRSFQTLKVLSYDNGDHLLFKNTNITVTLNTQRTRVPKVDEGNIPNSWAANTFLRVEVVQVEQDDDASANISVGTIGETVKSGSEIAFGKISRDEIPHIINAVESYTRESIGSFDSCMRKMKSFKNPRAIHHLTKELGVTMKNTSMMSTLRNGFDKKDCYKSIRRTQLCRWAHKHVTEGIALYKRGDNTEAFQLLKKALSIDPENVEAFVAKGALSANLGNFQSALEDFQYALKYDPNHGNAKKYMCETLLALGRKFEESHKFGSAEGCYLRCLKLDPEHRDCYKELCNLHDKSGFKGSITKEVLRSMDPDNVEEIIMVSPDVNENEEKLAKNAKDSQDTLPTKSNREGSFSPITQKQAMQHMNHSPPPYSKAIGSIDHKSDNSQSLSKKSVTVPKFVIGKSKGKEVVPAVSSNENRSSEITMDGEEIVQDIPITRVPKSVKKPVVVEKIEGNPVALEGSDETPVVVGDVNIDKVEISEPVSELQKSYEAMLGMTPADASEVQQLSMALIILAKRFRYEGNVTQAKNCLEKSLKHNPRHEATLTALLEISKAEKEKKAKQNAIKTLKKGENKIQSINSSAPIESVTPARPNPVPYFSSVPPPNFPGAGNFGLNQQNYYPDYQGMYQYDVPPPNMYSSPSSPWPQPPSTSAELKSSADDDYDAKVASFLEKIGSRKFSDRSGAQKPSPRESSSDRSRSPVRNIPRQTVGTRSSKDRKRRRSSSSRSSSRTGNLRNISLHRRGESPSGSKNGISGRRSRSSSKNLDKRRNITEKELPSDSKVKRKLSSRSSSVCETAKEIEHKKTTSTRKISEGSEKKMKKSDKAKRKKESRSISSSSSSSSSDSSSSDSSVDKKSKRSKKKKKKESKDKKLILNEAIIKGVDESFIKQLKESIRKDLEAEMKAKKKKSKVSKSKDKEPKKVKKDDSSSKSENGDKEKSRKLPKVPINEHKAPVNADPFKAIEKAAEDTSINIKGIFEMPNLEDLQKKIRDFYSKVDGRKDATSDEAISKICSEDSKHRKITKSPVRAENEGEEVYGPSYEDFIKEKKPLNIKEKGTSRLHNKEKESSRSNMKQKESSRTIIKGKDESSPSNIAVCSGSKSTNDMELSNPTSAVSFGFKSTFKPVTPANIEIDHSEEHRKKAYHEFITMQAYQGILTPTELKSGIKEKKMKQYEEIVEKARKKAEAIGKTRSNIGRNRRTKDSPSDCQVRSRSISRRSRSRNRRSRSRSRRSRSRSRRSRSRSRRSRSGSRRSRSRSRRSRSRSRRSRSRSRRSRSRSRRSRSRSRRSRSRSRSGSRSRRYQLHSRGRFQRRGFYNQNNRGSNRERNVRGIFSNYSRGRNFSQRNMSRSASRDRSCSRGRKESPDYPTRSRSRSSSSSRKQKRSRSRSSSLNRSSKKTKIPNSMFGKWVAEEDLKDTNDSVPSARRPFLQF